MFEMKLLFIRFLKCNKAYKRFIKNLTTLGQVHSVYFTQAAPSEWIDRAFTWVCSTEDWEYWHTLHVKWASICNHIKSRSEDNIFIDPLISYNKNFDLETLLTHYILSNPHLSEKEQLIWLCAWKDDFSDTLKLCKENNY